MNFLQIVVAVIILYLCIYALINRVCKCIEHCASASSTVRLLEPTPNSEKTVCW